MVIVDWYWRMQLQSSLTEMWLAKGDLKQARIEAEKFLEVSLVTAEAPGRRWLGMRTPGSRWRSAISSARTNA